MDPVQIRFTTPAPLTSQEIEALWWGIEHLPAMKSRLTLDEVVRWQGVWQTGMRLLAQMDLSLLPHAARDPFVAFITAWTPARARWWLRRCPQVVFTQRVQGVLGGLHGHTAAERRLLTARRKLWWAHYLRYWDRHPTGK